MPQTTSTTTTDLKIAPTTAPEPIPASEPAALDMDDVLGLKTAEATAEVTVAEKLIYPLSIAEGKFNKLVKLGGFNAKEKNAVIGTRIVLCALIFANMPKDEQIKAVKGLPTEVRAFALGINSKK